MPAEAESTALWQEGWYAFARKFASPNFGPRPPEACIDLVVIHSISLPPGQYGGPEVAQLFSNTLDWNTPLLQEYRGACRLRAFLHPPQRRTLAVRQLRRSRLARGQLALPRTRQLQR